MPTEKKSPPAEKKSHLGSNYRKAQPKLRLVSNGDTNVNAARAMQCGAIAITGEKLLEEKAAVVTDEAAPYDPEKDRSAPKGKQRSLPRDISVNVFVQKTTYVNPGTFLKDKIVLKEEVKKNKKNIPTRETAQNTNLATATVRMSDLPKLLEDPNVVYVELAENIKTPDPKVEGPIGESFEDKREIKSEHPHKFGEDVLIGIIDVGGFDFSHPDFLDGNNETRFIRIWDQGGNSRPSPYRTDAEGARVRETYDYGSEIRAEHMNEAIRSAPALGLQPYDLEPQSEMTPGSHGTHVASIAAGKMGVARRAKIAAVLIGTPARESEDNTKKSAVEETIYQKRRSSFYDSTQIVHAIDYLIDLADSERQRAVSINISLGTNGHAHDGTSPVCRWIEAWLNKRPGTSVTVAAGNAGQEEGRTVDDLGYVVGRIHTSGQIPSRGLSADIEWQVIGDGNQDMSENELEIWYSAQDDFGVQVKPPGQAWTEIIYPLEFIENRQLLPNQAFLSIYNETYHSANGLNCISIYLSPNLAAEPPIGSLTGMWRVRLYGREIRDGRFHGWIERDDPRRGVMENGREIQFLPSFFSKKSNVDNSSVNSLACTPRIISVANLDEPGEVINITSSQGPTRDGRFKPDIAAPGTNIIAAKGFSNDDKEWISMSGTSMAAPYVTGLIGLMLNINPGLTAAQIEGIIQSTANPLPGGTYNWIDSAGFGRIDIKACLDKAVAVDKRMDMTKKGAAKKDATGKDTTR